MSIVWRWKIANAQVVHFVAFEVRWRALEEIHGNDRIMFIPLEASNGEHAFVGGIVLRADALRTCRLRLLSSRMEGHG